jgi:hypothetical protein
MKSNNILAFAFLFSAFLFGAAQITFAQDKQNDLKFKRRAGKRFSGRHGRRPNRSGSRSANSR